MSVLMARDLTSKRAEIFFAIVIRFQLPAKKTLMY